MPDKSALKSAMQTYLMSALDLNLQWRCDSLEKPIKRAVPHSLNLRLCPICQESEDFHYISSQELCICLVCDAHIDIICLPQVNPFEVDVLKCNPGQC